MRQKKLAGLSLFPLLCASLLFNSCGGGQTNADNAPATNAGATAGSTPSPGAAQAPSSNTPQRVTATVEEARLAAGGEGEAAVRLDVADGYHVHANPASDRFYVATEVRAEPQEGVTPGKPVYPPALSKKFSFSDKPLAVYEGSVLVRLPLRADKAAAKGRHTLRATIRVQPCNDLACEPPRNIDAAIPVTID